LTNEAAGDVAAAVTIGMESENEVTSETIHAVRSMQIDWLGLNFAIKQISAFSISAGTASQLCRLPRASANSEREEESQIEIIVKVIKKSINDAPLEFPRKMKLV
jgi:hypothetical protein